MSSTGMRVSFQMLPEQPAAGLLDAIAVADRLGYYACYSDDWVRWLTGTYSPAGLNHALVSFTDPYTLRAWAGIDVPGLPELQEQIRLFGEQVLPAL